MSLAAGAMQLAESSNQFSLELYKNIIGSKSPGNNVFFSPFSITAALAMVSAGAQGPTRDQVLNGIHLKSGFPETIQINSAFNQMFTTLNIQTTGSTLAAKTPTKGDFENFHTDPPQLNLANKVYIQDGVTVKQPFAKVLETSYQSVFGNEDFKKHPGVAKDHINDWVENVTHNKIKDLFSGFESDTRLVLVSAIYFKAGWEMPFTESETREKDFSLANGKTVQAKFMKDFDGHTFAEFPELNANALLLPYTDNKFHLIVVLPNQKNGLSNLEKALTMDVFNTSLYSEYEIDLLLPKFKVEDKYELKDTLVALGIRDIFTNRADFSGISEERLMVASVVHKSFVDVNEKGTEAAAATGILMIAESATLYPEERKKQFHADHPFLFAIQHKQSGLVLFLGKIENPTVA